ncbi:MAG: YigZ family protein [Clostridiales bacterium]|nr:YigZ family protein [Clostridiales bacterium]
MSINGYIRVKNDIENEIIIEKSRFITYVKKTPTEDEAKEFIDGIRKKHPFATHNCYAYVTDAGKTARFSDDGEPQGTAGIPMLEVIKNRDLKDTAVVVTRYFGGIKLGAGGLVRAYSSSTSQALDKAGIEENLLADLFLIKFGYDKYSLFLKFIENRKTQTVSADFSEEIVIKIAIPSTDTSFVEKLTDYFLGKVEIVKDGQTFVVFGG